MPAFCLNFPRLPLPRRISSRILGRTYKNLCVSSPCPFLQLFALHVQQSMTWCFSETPASHAMICTWLGPLPGMSPLSIWQTLVCPSNPQPISLPWNPPWPEFWTKSGQFLYSPRAFTFFYSPCDIGLSLPCMCLPLTLAPLDPLWG